MDLPALVKQAKDRYDAMTPAEKAYHDHEQRRSFVRGMCSDKQDYKEWCEIVDRALPPLDRVCGVILNNGTPLENVLSADECQRITDAAQPPLPIAPRSCHPYDNEPGLRLFFYTEQQASDFVKWLLTLPVPQPPACSDKNGMGE